MKNSALQQSEKIKTIKPENAARAKKERVYFDCEKCPAFCCSVYERVSVSDEDLERLAQHFNVSLAEAEKLCTKKWEDERILKRQRDPLLGEACRFLDLQTRACTIYEARPETCRDYPTQKRCVYYDLLQFERRHQDDPEALPLVQIEFREWKRKPRDKGE
jgi:Fe-S-cluster containining protein